MSTDQSFQFARCSRGLIFGGSKGIGLGFTNVLNELFPHLEIHVTTRKKSKEVIEVEANSSSRVITHLVDPSSENDIQNLSKQFENHGLDFIINCIGLLHDNEVAPEKSLRTVDFKNIEKIFQINSTITPIIAKHFENKLTKSISLFTSISAKVGSITDNRMGGWYSYRASKAALNMFLKCISIEFERKKKKLSRSLSSSRNNSYRPLQALYTKDQIPTSRTKTTAKNLINVIQSKSLKDNGKFFAWSGEELPW